MIAYFIRCNITLSLTLCFEDIPLQWYEPKCLEFFQYYLSLLVFITQVDISSGLFFNVRLKKEGIDLTYVLSQASEKLTF